jgi:hypothetical protein
VASTYVNNLRLEEMTTGEKAGTWGNITNTNLQLVGQALGYGTRAIANASTDNITIADGASDADRSMYLKLTGGGQACTVTLLPNTSSKMWIMENATSYTLTFTQGSGANVAIPAGQTKMIFADGLGAGAVVYELGTIAVQNLSVTGVTSNADGSAAAPSITNTGDTNTGIFFPAADTVGVAVGGTEIWRYGSNPTTAKNLITNGAMTVAQRGTSFTALTDAYCLDQFIYIKDASTAVIDVTQSTDVPSGEGFGKSLKIDVTTADASIDANDLAKIQTPIEAQNLTQLKYGSAGAQTMTLSFWIKSTKTGTFNAFAYQPDANRFYNASYTVNVTDTWEHKTVTISGDSGGTINDDTGAGLIVGWTLIAGTNWTGSADTWSGNADYAVSSYSMLDSTSNNILIAGVQLEVGSVATDFEHEDIGETLAKCQRYFRRWNIQDASSQIFGAITMNAATAAVMGPVSHPVRMRGAPTASISNLGHIVVADGANLNRTASAATFYAGVDAFNVYFTIASGTLGGGYIYRDVSDALYFDFTAEL